MIDLPPDYRDALLALAYLTLQGKTGGPPINLVTGDQLSLDLRALRHAGRYQVGGFRFDLSGIKKVVYTCVGLGESHWLTDPTPSPILAIEKVTLDWCQADDEVRDERVRTAG